MNFIRKHLYIITLIITIALIGGIIFFKLKLKEKSFIVSENSESITETIEEEKEESSSLESNTQEEPVVSQTIYVDVKGQVETPGLYQIEEGRRVADVLALAGGVLPDGDTSLINLAQKLEDSMVIIVYTKEEIEKYKQEKLTTIQPECPDVINDACINNDTPTTNQQLPSNNSSPEETKSKISINKATKEELMTLESIGESKAQAIITYREENGLFQSLEELMNVSGIGETLFEKIKDDITL